MVPQAMRQAVYFCAGSSAWRAAQSVRDVEGASQKQHFCRKGTLGF